MSKSICYTLSIVHSKCTAVHCTVVRVETRVKKLEIDIERKTHVDVHVRKTRDYKQFCVKMRLIGQHGSGLPLIHVHVYAHVHVYMYKLYCMYMYMLLYTEHVITCTCRHHTCCNAPHSRPVSSIGC